MRNERGMAIAQRLRELWIQGCDVRIAYTVMGVDVFRFLGAATARGPVPKKHLVQDFDGDGEFDNYFHLKALTINGVYDGNPDELRDPQRLVELVGVRRGLRRELRDPDPPLADAEVPALHRLLVRELPEERRRWTRASTCARSTATRTSTWTDACSPPGRVSAASTTTGIALWGFGDRAIDVLFDGRRVWSFWLERDTRTTVPGVRSIEWPSALRKFLDGQHPADGHRARQRPGPLRPGARLRHR